VEHREESHKLPQILLISLAVAIWFANASAHGVHLDANPSSTITAVEAGSLINLLPSVKELRTKGMDAKWEQRAIPDMNNIDFYFFWVYNVAAQKKNDIGSISVGNYAINKHSGDVKAWSVSPDVFHGDDGALVITNELLRLQEELRKKHGIDSGLIQEYRSEHLAARIAPLALEQSAVRLPIAERSTETAMLSCWKSSKGPNSRIGRSPVISSSANDRAYAEVRAIAFKPKYQETYAGSLCENSIKLFLTRRGAPNSQILLDSRLPKNSCVTVEGQDRCGVNGIKLVDWSRDGRFLLAELVLWEYESDSGFTRVPIVYDRRGKDFIRPDVYHFFDKYYRTGASKENCEFALLTEGFSPEGNLIMAASRPPLNPSHDQVFCFNGKQTVEFELETNKIRRLPATYKLQHYGTWNSGDISEP
jgi:hypothetical protein